MHKKGLQLHAELKSGLDLQFRLLELQFFFWEQTVRIASMMSKTPHHQTVTNLP
jgi:hypothetical protein